MSPIPEVVSRRRTVPSGVLTSASAVIQIRMLNFEDLRLDAFKGLAHLGAQTDLPDRKLLEGPDVLHSNAQYRCQDPALVLRVLPVHVTPLPLERVHQQVGAIVGVQDVPTKSVYFHDSGQYLVVVGRRTCHGDFYSAKQVPVLAHVGTETGRH